MTNSLYKISTYYRPFYSLNKKEGVIYHSLLGNGLVASTKLIRMLNDLRFKTKIKSKDLNLPVNLLNILKQRRLIISHNEHENTSFNKLPEINNNCISHLRLCLTDNCNMKCSYCHMQCQRGSPNMSIDVARISLSSYYALLKRNKIKGKVTFFGGEPLLNWETLKYSIGWIKKHDTNGEYISQIYIATNGTLLTSSMAEFLLKNKVTVSISLDGLEDKNDEMRRMRNDSGSFQFITKGINILQEVGHKQFSLIAVIGNHNIDCIEDIILFAHKKGISLSFHNAFAEPKAISWSYPDYLMVERFFSASNYAKKLGMRVHGPWRWPFAKAFAFNQNPIHCLASGKEFSITVDGKIKPCPGFDTDMGSIDNFDQVFSNPLYDKVYKRRAPFLKDCKGCDLEGLCGGGCMVNAKKNHNGDIFRKDDSCYIVKSLFIKFMNEYVDGLQ
ncbi:MAG: radical SAM protein [Pseudomonadota bacterium]